VRAGARGEQAAFQRTIEALVVEERAKQHHVLADQLASYLGPHSLPQTVSPPRAQMRVNELLHEILPRRRLDEMILSDRVRNACRELVEEQHGVELLRANALEPRHRVLLVGPPGNGKTSLAEAIATELAVPLVVARYEGLIASYLGETAVRLAKLFAEVRQQPCVLFFDEFDVVGKERGDVHETGEVKRVVSSLLLQIDALPSHVVVVTATNHAELLDRAVWRRFQLRLELVPPNRAGLISWLSQLEARLGQPLGRQLTVIAKRLGTPSYAELEQFGLDVERRWALAMRQGSLAKIVDERLAQWADRVAPRGGEDAHD